MLSVNPLVFYLLLSMPFAPFLDEAISSPNSPFAFLVANLRDGSSDYPDDYASDLVYPGEIPASTPTSTPTTLNSDEPSTSFSQYENWAGDILCVVGEDQLTGTWEFTVTGSNAIGEVSLPGILSGDLIGKTDGQNLNARIYYTFLGHEYIYDWNGTLDSGVAQGTVVFRLDEERSMDCTWGGGPAEKAPYGNTTRFLGGNQINITYVPVCTENCTKIVFIQVVCRKAIFNDGTEAALYPSNVSAGWADKDGSTVDGGRLCTVDYLAGELDPYYNGDDRPKDGGVQGKHAGSLNATMRDSPFYPASVFQRLNASFGKPVRQVVLEFETCAFCAEGADAGKYYDCFRWNYEKTNGGPEGSSDQGTTGDPSRKFKEAVDEWSRDNGFPLPK